MKIRKWIYIITGSLLIIFNLLLDLIAWSEGILKQEDQAYYIGYFIGSNIFIITGLLFLWAAYRLHKKIRKLKRNELEDSINSIGKN